MNALINQHIVTINDKPYVISAFVGTKGFKLLAKLTKYATPVIASLMEVRGKVDEDGNLIEDDAIANLDLSGMMHNLFLDGTDGFVDLVLDLVADVESGGMKINVDTEFKKNYMSLVKLAFEVVKYNYADVFQELGMNIES